MWCYAKDCWNVIRDSSDVVHCDNCINVRHTTGVQLCMRCNECERPDTSPLCFYCAKGRDFVPATQDDSA